MNFRINIEKKIPHPPHEYAARRVGIHFMNKVNELGLYMDYWFPGDFFNSEEVEEYIDGEEVHTRVFHLTLLYNKAQEKLCKLSLMFPHLDEYFHFKEPVLKISEIYDKNPEQHVII